MRKLNLTLAALLATSTFAVAEVVEFNFPINVDQTVPAANIPGGFSPSGSGFVSLDTDTNELNWEITYSDLTGEIVAPGAHFHGPADFGDTAGVEVFLSDGSPPEPASGMLIGSATLTDQQESDLLDGLWYVNIHTAMNQPGEIRGQVVPEPTSALGLVLAGLVALRRR